MTTTVPRKVIGCVQLWDVLDHIGFSDAEVEAISDYGLDGVSFGDATYTLIGNNFALDCIVNGLEAYYDELESLEGDHPSRMIPARIYTRKDITEMFWKVVDKDDYVDLETW